MIGSIINGEIEQKTKIIFKNFSDFETFINTIDIDYGSEDVIFTGLLYKLKAPDFNTVNRSQNERGTDFEQDIVEYMGSNCYIPTSGNCFIKCINLLTSEDYTEDFLNFFQSEQRRSNVMTSARTQPFCKKNIIST